MCSIACGACSKFHRYIKLYAIHICSLHMQNHLGTYTNFHILYITIYIYFNRLLNSKIDVSSLPLNPRPPSPPPFPTHTLYFNTYKPFLYSYMQCDTYDALKYSDCHTCAYMFMCVLFCAPSHGKRPHERCGEVVVSSKSSHVHLISI